MTYLPRTLGIIGAGQMGRGIAQVAAQNGCTVLLTDISAQLTEEGKTSIDRILAKLVAKGKLLADDRKAILDRIRPAEGIGPLAQVDMVIEAVSENPELKKKLFMELDKTVQAGAILASNTSSISITLLGAQTRRPEKVIGMHFMNPVPLMALVEIVRGMATDDATVRTTMDLAEKFGKIHVTSQDRPGFIVNRVLMPLLNEAIYALNESMASIEDIDTAVKLGLNHPMGPFALADLIGLDTCLSIMEVLHRDLGEDKYRPCPLLRQYVAAGWLGRKTGRGFYTYQQK